MFDALLNDIFSFVASMGLEELKELKAQYTNQQILHLTIKQFAESNMFRSEYRDVVFCDLKDEIMSTSSNLILPTLELPQIANNLSPLLEKCFITDNANSFAHIKKSISMQYITKSNLTVSLLDLVHHQRKNTEKIISSVSDLKPELFLIAKTVISYNEKKELALQKGINRKIFSFIFSAAQNFILIVTKTAPVTHGMTDEKGMLHRYMDIIQELIFTQFPTIDDEFYIKPIRSFTMDKRIPFQQNQVEIDAYQMLSLYKKELSIKSDELLKYFQVLPDDFFISMIELMDYISTNPAYTVYDMGYSQLVKQAKPAKNFNMVQFIKNEYTRLGNLILSLEKYI